MVVVVVVHSKGGLVVFHTFRKQRRLVNACIMVVFSWYSWTASSSASSLTPINREFKFDDDDDGEVNNRN